MAPADHHVDLGLAGLDRQDSVYLKLVPMVHPPDPHRHVAELRDREADDRAEVLVVVAVQGVVAMHPQLRLTWCHEGRGAPKGRCGRGGVLPEGLP